MNNQAFIDGQNLNASTANARPSWRVDLNRFRRFLREKYHVEEAYYFVGCFSPLHQDLYAALQRGGFIVVFREHAGTSLSHKKGNVDTDIVFAVMRKLVDREKFDKVILVSGDGDYWRMVDYLIKKDKFAKLLVPNELAMSSLYRTRTPDTYRVFLDSPDIKRKIAKMRGRN